MLESLFWWRKSSKCKRLVKMMSCRLKLIISKRRAIVRQVRDDVGKLLKLGHDQTIFARIDQLYMDEILITVYELLNHFCEFIAINLPHIRRNRHCPDDVNEAISTLVFASARCGDVPELRTFRELVQDRYGHKFVKTALELLPGNFVNPQIVEKLSVTSASEDAKLRMVNEIFRDYCLQPQSLAIQFRQEWHQKQANEDSTIGTKYAMILEKQDDYVTERRAGFASASNSPSENCFSLKASDIVGYNQARPPQVTEMENLARVSHLTSSSSCSDVSIHLPDENLVYLDDVEEFRSPKLYDCSSPDRRIFMFKSDPMVNVQSGQTELRSRMRAGLRKSLKSRSRRLPKKSPSRESVNQSLMGLSKTSTEPLQQNHPSKVLNYVTEPFSAKRGKYQCHESNGLGFSKDMSKLRTQDQMQRDLTAEQASGLNKPCEAMESSNGSNSVVSAPTEKNIAVTFYVKDAETCYLRAFTLPAERHKDQRLEMYSRTSSLPVPNQVNHVHPKLPDCDQIEAKFSALKQDYQHSHPLRISDQHNLV